MCSLHNKHKIKPQWKGNICLAPLYVWYPDVPNRLTWKLVPLPSKYQYGQFNVRGHFAESPNMLTDRMTCAFSHFTIHPLVCYCVYTIQPTDIILSHWNSFYIFVNYFCKIEISTFFLCVHSCNCKHVMQQYTSVTIIFITYYFIFE